MRVNKWTLGLAALGLIRIPAIVQAEEKPNQLLAALSATTISGYVDTSAHWTLGTGNAIAYDSNLPSRRVGFNLNVVDIVIEKPLDEGTWSAGYKADLIFGPNVVGWNSLANALIGIDNEVAIKQAYVALRAPIGNGLDLKIGTFDTIIGYEVFDGGSNPNYSHSFGYDLGSVTYKPILTIDRGNDTVVPPQVGRNNVVTRNEERRNSFFGVGIDTYNGKQFETLKYAVSGVRKAREQFDSLGFKSVMSTDRDASKQAILTRLREFLTATAPSEMFVFYYSGHGVSDRDGDRAIATADGQLLSLTEVEALLSEHPGPSLMVFDCCFTESTSDILTSKLWNNDSHHAEHRPAVLIATDALGGVAFSREEIGGGLLTHCLSGLLKRAAGETETRRSRTMDFGKIIKDSIATTSSFGWQEYRLLQKPGLLSESDLAHLSAVPINPLTPSNPDLSLITAYELVTSPISSLHGGSGEVGSHGGMMGLNAYLSAQVSGIGPSDFVLYPLRAEWVDIGNSVCAVGSTVQYDLWANVLSRLELRWEAHFSPPHLESGIWVDGESSNALFPTSNPVGNTPSDNARNSFGVAMSIIYSF